MVENEEDESNSCRQFEARCEPFLFLRLDATTGERDEGPRVERKLRIMYRISRERVETEDEGYSAVAKRENES